MQTGYNEIEFKVLKMMCNTGGKVRLQRKSLGCANFQIFHPPFQMVSQTGRCREEDHPNYCRSLSEGKRVDERISRHGEHAQVGAPLRENSLWILRAILQR